MLNEQISSIPWLQLTTPYGRGTAIPQLIEQEQYTELAELVEHQGTLWQVTPWVLLVLLKKLASKDTKEALTTFFETVKKHLLNCQLTVFYRRLVV
ncbi:hypothetical protein [Lysinibacillus sp. Y5S-8]|uniref:hypothetical protein n=1 Tax=Lysinibacillus sp. Y5S-8 TaxID=3122488 RepID=UPI00116CDEDA